MAKRSSGRQEPQCPSFLLTTHEDARAKLSERITLGREMLRVPIRSFDDHKAVEQKYYTWTEYNEALLRRLFDTEDEVNEYQGGGLAFVSVGGEIRLSDEIKDLHDRITSKVRKLESLQERLSLYTVSATLTVSPRPVQQVSQPSFDGREVFIVHGRDEHMKEAVARLVSTLGLEPIILNEQVNLGRTIIQKFMDHANKVVYAIVLLTPDDVGRLASEEAGELKPRARQNVLMELGFFLGRLGPERVCAIRVGNVELPSDYSGVLFIPYDAAGAWRFQVAQEMHAAGIPVDMNKLLSK